MNSCALGACAEQTKRGQIQMAQIGSDIGVSRTVFGEICASYLFCLARKRFLDQGNRQIVILFLQGASCVMSSCNLTSPSFLA